MVKYFIMKKILFAFAVLLAGLVFAEEQIIDGKKMVCKDGICMLVEEGVDEAGSPLAPDWLSAAADVDSQKEKPSGGVTNEPPASVADSRDGARTSGDQNQERPLSSATPETGFALAVTPRVAQGYMDVDEFLAFLENSGGKDGEDGSGSFLGGKSWWLIILLVVAGGLVMNFTPCVLPMIPINLMIIGRSAVRGALYGAGIAIAYGVLGVLAAVGGMAFGEVQGNPWFNTAIAVLFTVLALSMLGVFFIDFSKKRNNFAALRSSMWPGVFAFFMGMVSAVLAGACVAPILIAVLLLTADLFAKGVAIALALPFLLGLGMALPWPFAGAGLQVLPKPGAWMTKVNKIFGVIVLGFAAYYGFLAYSGFVARNDSGGVSDVADLVDKVNEAEGPVLVDCWATWCKNCSAMEKNVLADEKVGKVLKDKGFTVIRMQCENGIGELKTLPGCADIKGLPAFLVFEKKKKNQ